MSFAAYESVQTARAPREDTALRSSPALPKIPSDQKAYGVP